MKGKWKTFLALCLSILTMAGIFSACGKEEKPSDIQTTPPPSKTEDIVDLVYYAPGADMPDMQNVLKEVNAKMQKDGVMVNLIVKHLGWDVWDDRINVMLATGEEFDMFHVMENRVTTGVYASRGGLAPLTKLIDQYGPDIKREVPEFTWDQITINGEIYSLPAYWRDTTQYGSPVGSLIARKDLLDKYGFELPETFEDFMEIMTTIKSSEPGMEDAYFWEHEPLNPSLWMERTFDTFPFYADFNNLIVCVRENGEVSSWVETDEFKQEAKNYRRMYEAGLVHPDVLSVPRETKTDLISQGKLIITSSGFDAKSYRENYPEAEIASFMMASDKPSYVSLPLWNSNAVPASSKHPEAAVKFINWLYADRENHDLFLFGVKGTHHEVINEMRFKPIMDPATNSALYRFDFWQIGHYKWQRFDEFELDIIIKQSTTSAENVMISRVAGFVFNTEPVKNEYANLQATIPEVIFPIKFGVIPLEGNYESALQRLKAAGLDAVVAEYEKQFKAWKAKR